MMKISLLTILLITGVFAQELEVEGSLKVTGEIDASNQRVTNVGNPSELSDAVNTEFLQNALRDDATYEYIYYFVAIPKHQHNYGDVSYQVPIKYFSMDWTDNGDGWQQKINSLSSDGWIIHQQIQAGWSGTTYQVGGSFLEAEIIVVTLKRPLSE